MVRIGFRMAGKDNGDSSFSALIMYGVWDAQMTGGFEGNGRQRVENAEEAGRLIVLWAVRQIMTFHRAKKTIHT